MKMTYPVAALSLALACGSGLAADKKSVLPRKPPLREPAKLFSGSEAAPSARSVAYGERDIIPIKAKLRHTTMIVLPKEEQILDVTCGDKDFWVVSANHNFAYVKPAKAGSRTNLNIIAASGTVYSFLLTDVSDIAGAEPDFKVFVEANADTLASTASSPRFVSVQVVEDLERQLRAAKEETRQAKEAAKAAVDAGIAKFLANVRFPFRFEAGKKPFFVRAMYHDDKFTYIQARPEEAPALYEIRDGRPNLINFDYKNGVYVVDKILDEGYLTIGKRKQHFSRQE